MTTTPKNEALETAAIETLEGSGKTIAHMVGQRYRQFEPVPREPLAAIFKAHGFLKSAEALLTIDAHTALQAVITRRGTTRVPGS